MLVKNIENVGLDYALITYLNSFTDDEKDAVELVFQTAREGIAKDFGIKSNLIKQSDEE
jgi:hypothetical protein